MKILNNLFKTTILLLFTALLFTGCSKNDDNSSSDFFQMGDNPEFALFETDIILPTALENNTDPQAQELVSHVSLLTYIKFMLISLKYHMTLR